MKKIVLITFALVLTSAILTASNPEGINEKIFNEITYPEFARQSRIEGIVAVSFLVSNDGLINVEMVNASNEDLKNYVMGKLRNMVLPESIAKESRHQLRFVFKLL